jgi:IclR family transcriptional regulator, pca regulon regulatory protein
MGIDGIRPQVEDDPDDREKESDHGVILSVMRALDVLEVFGRTGKSLSLGEIAGAASMTRSSVQRAAHALLKRGYLEQSPKGGLLPGRRVLDRSFDDLRLSGLVEWAVPLVHELRQITNERFDLSLYDCAQIVCAARLQIKRKAFYATLIDQRVPTFRSLGGWDLLAAPSEAEMEPVLAEADLRFLTPKTTVDSDMIRGRCARRSRTPIPLRQRRPRSGKVLAPPRSSIVWRACCGPSTSRNPWASGPLRIFAGNSRPS